jgi:hypothetical protein
MMAKVEWGKPDHVPQYGPCPVVARLGKFVVGSVIWNQIQKGQPPYQANLRLPGYKEILGKYEDEAEAKAHVERATASWVKSAGLMAAEQAANK